MTLFTKSIREQLIRNGTLMARYAEEGRTAPDFAPVVRLFTPDAACIWLLTELDPDEKDIAFGLCDLGVGFPELGRVRISELETIRGRLGLRVKRDLHFNPCKTISVYAEEARLAGSITA